MGDHSFLCFCASREEEMAALVLDNLTIFGEITGLKDRDVVSLEGGDRFVTQPQYQR